MMYDVEIKGVFMVLPDRIELSTSPLPRAETFIDFIYEFQ